MKTITLDYYELWLCQDCALIACNGDCDDLDEYRELEVSAGFKRLALDGPLSADFNADDANEGIDEFSFRQCACCLSRLGGYRARFTQFIKP